MSIQQLPQDVTHSDTSTITSEHLTRPRSPTQLPHKSPQPPLHPAIKTSSSAVEDNVSGVLEIGISEKAPVLFRNVWHEMMFIYIVTSAQLITQCNLGNTIMPIAAIAEGLGIADQLADQSWFVASYSCTVGAFVLITGRLGDLYGRRNLFLIGWIWLAIFNLAAGFARNHIVFDVLRALSGIGPSILMPNAAALLAGAWPNPASRHDQSRKILAFCIFGAIAPAGYILGAAWGSAVIHVGLQWGWIYWSMAVVCAMSVIMAWWVVPDTPELNGRGEGDVDYLGGTAGVAGLVLVFVALNGAPKFGWRAPLTPVLLVLGFLSLFLFTLIERKVAHPILPLSIFRSPTFVAVAISLCGGWMSFGMFQYYNPHFLMVFRGLSGLQTSLQMVPCAIIGIVAAVASMLLLPRVPGYVIFGASMLCFFAGQTMLAFTPVVQSYWVLTFPTCVIICFGPDLSFACASLIASDKLPPEQQGVAGSFINTVVNYSVALGMALAGNVEMAVAKGDELRGIRATYYLGMGLAAMGAVFTACFSKGMAKKHRPE